MILDADEAGFHHGSDKDRKGGLNLKAPSRGRLILGILLIVAFLITSTIVITPGASADDGLDANLAEAFAPELKFNSAERCFPVTVDYYLESCSLNQVDDDSSILVTEKPTVAQLAVLTSDGHFLSNRNGGVDDDGVIEAHEENRTSLDLTPLIGHTV